MDKPIVLFSEKEFEDKETRRVLLAISYGESYSMLDLLGSLEKLTFINNICPLQVDSWNGLPVLTISPLAIESRKDELFAKAVTVLETVVMVKNISKDLLKRIVAEKRSSWFPTASDSFLEFFTDFCADSLRPYFNRKLSIKVGITRNNLFNDKRITEIKEAVNQMNLSSSMTSRYVSAAQNVAIKQTKPSDRFYIPLPKYEDFKNDSVLAEIVPDLRTVFTPFTHKAYYSPIWMRLMGKTEAQRRQVFMAENQSASGLHFNEEDIDSWVEYPIDHITGNTENDDLDILDNEREWYNAFLEFIRMDLEVSYTTEVAEKMFATGGLSPEMESFFDAILESTLLINWSCSGQFLISNFTGMDDEDDENRDIENENDSERNSGIELSLYYADTNPGGFNGLEAITTHIKKLARGSNQIAGQGCKTYAEAVVKLARWGDRRPANLKLDGESSYFSLINFRTQDRVLNFDKMEIKKINGRSLSLLGFIRLTWVLQDEDYKLEHGVSGKISNVPIGVITERSFEGEFELSQIMYLSLLDVITEYSKGNQFINGLDFENGKFSTSISEDGYSEELNAAIKSVQDGQDCTIYVSEGLQALARDINQKALLLSELIMFIQVCKNVGGPITATPWFKDLVLENKQDVTRLVSKGIAPPSSIQLRTLKHVLPLYMMYSDVVREHEFDLNWEASEYFDTFLRIAKELGIQSATDFYSFEEAKPQMDANVSKLSAFGGVDTKTDVSEMDNKTAANETPSSTNSEHKIEVSNNTEEKSQQVELLGFQKLLNDLIFTDHESIKSVRPITQVLTVGENKEKVKKVLAYYGQAIVPGPGGKPVAVVIIFSEEELLSSMRKEEKGSEFSSFTLHFLRILGDIFTGVSPNTKVAMFASPTTARNILNAVRT